jgi:hypothetical protein
MPLNSGVRRSKSVHSAGLSRRGFFRSDQRIFVVPFAARAVSVSAVLASGFGNIRCYSQAGCFSPWFQVASIGSGRAFRHFGFGGFGVSVRLPAWQLALTVAPNNSFKRTAGCGLGSSRRSRPAAA